MPLVDFHSYRFNRAAQWAVCGLDGFIRDGDDLTVGGAGGWLPLSVSAEDRNPLAIAAVGDDGFAWLRDSGELVLHSDGEIVVLGILEVDRLAGREEGSGQGDRKLNCLAVGRDRIWLAGGGFLRTYHRLYLQELSRQRIGPAMALVVDHDGAWCLVDCGANACRWLHFGEWGGRDGAEVPCQDGPAPFDGAFDPCSARLLVVDGEAVRSWDPCADDWSLVIDLSPFRCHFEPDRIAVDCRGFIHLLDRTRGIIWSFAGDGVRRAQLTVPADAAQGVYEEPVREGLIAAGKTIAFAGGSGVFQLGQPSATSRQAVEIEPQEGIVLTPTLISPRDRGASWQRVRITAQLPAGTALRVRVAASEDDDLAHRVAGIAARPELSATQRLSAIYGLLPWDDSLEAVLAPPDDPLKLGSFDVLLENVAAPYLWLALHLHVPPTSRAATLQALEVRYPARSWIEDLPAVYRSEPKRAAELRRFLAVLETLFDSLEEFIDRLPERLMATNDNPIWHDFLLGWLGLPVPPELPAQRKREFLVEAPELLRRRGTPWALERALRIVTGRVVRIMDYGGDPLPWLLNGEGIQLGRNTLLIRLDRLGFALGREARLGRDGLGLMVPSTSERVAQRTQALRIEVDVEPGDDTASRASIAAVIDHFLPAACRYEVSMAPSGRPGQGRRLGRDARLAHSQDAEIGHTHTLGRSAIAAARPPEYRLGRRTWLDGPHGLA